jgi:DNA primase
LVAEAPDALDHKLARLTDGIDFTRDTHAVTTAVDTMLRIVAKAPKGLRVDQLLVRLSRSFELKVERLEQRLQSFRDDAKQKEQFAKRAAAVPRPPVQRSAHQSSGHQSSGDPNASFAESVEQKFDVVREAAPRARVQKMVPMSGLDRQLFETLIEAPELAGMAVETIDPDWFESGTARMLMSAYQDLEIAGRDLDVDSLLLLIENEQLKNEIVSLQCRIELRMGKLPETPQERYAMIMTRYRERAFTREASLQIQRLESASMNEDEEMELLNRLIEEDRLRRGIKSV